MNDLIVGFKFDNIGFNKISDLDEENQARVKHCFLQWEKKMMHSSAIHSVGQELNIDPNKVFHISVETKKESSTFHG